MSRGTFSLTSPPRPRSGKGFNFHTERPGVTITPEYVRQLYLSDRDRAILQFLSEVGYATTNQLGRLFWPGKAPQTVSKRLLSLWKQWVLDRQPFYRAPDYGMARQLVYMLGRAGVKILQDADGNVNPRRGTLLMPHNVMLCEAIVQLTERARELGSEHRITFRGESACYTAFEWDGNWIKMRPDGMIRLTVDDRSLPFYVEMDCNTASEIATKARQYSLYRRSKKWQEMHGEGFPGILMIVWSKYEAMDLSEEEATQRRRGKAQKRLEAVIEKLRDATRHMKTRWFCQRLDLVGKEPWRVVTPNGMKQSPPLFVDSEKAP